MKLQSSKSQLRILSRISNKVSSILHSILFQRTKKNHLNWFLINWCLRDSTLLESLFLQKRKDYIAHFKAIINLSNKTHHHFQLEIVFKQLETNIFKIKHIWKSHQKLLFTFLIEKNWPQLSSTKMRKQKVKKWISTNNTKIFFDLEKEPKHLF